MLYVLLASQVFVVLLQNPDSLIGLPNNQYLRLFRLDPHDNIATFPKSRSILFSGINKQERLAMNTGTILTRVMERYR
jgi:hypothetical protein